MIEQFKGWWITISEREQKLVLVSAIAFFIGILYWGLVQPLNNNLNDAQLKLKRAEQTLTWVQEKSTDIVKMGSANKKPIRNVKLSRLMTQTAIKYQIAFTRIVDKDQKVDLSLDEIEFNHLAKWMSYLKKNYGVIVLDIELSKTKKKGFVKVNRLSLGY